MPLKALAPSALKRRCDPRSLRFRTTAELGDLDEVLGQERAIEALRFGIGIRSDGFNLFALGPNALGKHTTVRQFLDRKAAKQETPADWCYIHDFDDAHRPKALKLPAGTGGKLHREMARLIEELQTAVSTVFESDEYRTRLQGINEEFRERQSEAFDELQKRARSREVALVRTPVGLALAPMRGEEVMSPEDFRKLPEAERERAEKTIQELQQELQETIQQIPRWDKERREKVREVNREVTNFAVGHLIDSMRHDCKALPAVVAHLDAVRADVIDNVAAFVQPPAGGDTQGGPGQDQPQGPPGTPGTSGVPAFLRRYRVNVIVDNGATEGAPVVYEDNPAQGYLVGRVEHLAQMGALITDFSLIQPGALHRANGGYLILDARKLLMQPYAYESLKRTLQAGEIRIESPGQMYGLVSTVSLEPEPIPLDVKVVLVGDRMLYYLLSAQDPDFGQLFKVAVDFEEDMDRASGRNMPYARLIATLARRDGLKPLNAAGVARVIEQASRLAGDSTKLSTRMGLICDILREADYWASEAGRRVIGAHEVQKTIDSQVRRADRMRERSQERIRRGTILLDTAGSTTGQVNGLSVISLGSYAFGRPSRITARVRMGRGEVMDIEREVDLGGPLHSKGVLILSAFLSAHYAADRPLSLSASLVFEQSYSGVDGDSASSAELYALLSALAEVPIKQSLAVTGSVNQFGQVQAIGGVNEKIEGFFDLCKANGLNGENGVLIPASNAAHLMLRDDVIEAARQGRFHIYPVKTIDQGIELLTGKAAGKRRRNGAFAAGTINRMVDDRLIALAEARRSFVASSEGKG